MNILALTYYCTYNKGIFSIFTIHSLAKINFLNFYTVIKPKNTNSTIFVPDVICDVSLYAEYNFPKELANIWPDTLT